MSGSRTTDSFYSSKVKKESEREREGAGVRGVGWGEGSQNIGVGAVTVGASDSVRKKQFVSLWLQKTKTTKY